MSLTIICPNHDCRGELQVHESQLGKPVRCGQCGRSFRATTVSTVDQAASTLPPSKSKPSSGAQAPGPHQGNYIGRFQVRATLGAGAFGRVHRAYDPVLDREVALKVPHASIAQSEEIRARFLREAKAAAQLRHPNIVPIYDAGTDGDQLYIASAFIQGQTLEEVIAGNRPDFHRAAKLVHDLAHAANYAHTTGIIHRDIKPANIMIDGDGRPLLMDFGLARIEQSQEKLTVEGTVMGTPAYMAPEQASGEFGEVAPASDQYSLAVTLYQLLCGKTPFSGPPSIVIFNTLNQEPPSPRSLNSAVPKDLETICLKAMSKRADRRFPDCGEFANDLRRWLDREPIHARRLGPVERFGRWCLRNPVIAGLSTAVLLVVFLALVGISSQWLRAQRNLDVANEQRQRANKNLVEARRQKKEAEVARKLADARATAEIEARKEAQRLAASLSMDRGHTLCEQGRLPEGLLWLTRTLESTPPEEEELARAVRSSLWAWSRQLSPVTALPQSEGSSQRSLHHELATAMDYCPQRDLIASGTEFGIARIWDTKTGTPVGPPLPHNQPISAIVFSPDGNLLATASLDGTARVWRLPDVEAATETLQHDGSIELLAFRPDSQVLASGGRDNSVRLWKMPSGLPLGDAIKLPGSPDTLAFSPDGTRLAVGCYRFAGVWEAASGTRLAELSGHNNSVQDLEFSPDGDLLATACDDYAARLWRVPSGELAGSPMLHTQDVDHVRFSFDGKKLITGSFDHTARIWEVPSGKPLTDPLNHQNSVHAVAFTPDGEIAITGSYAGDLRLWDAATGKALLEPLPYGDPVSYVWFDRSGKVVITASSENTLMKWQLPDGQPINRPILRHGNRVLTVAVSADGEFVATGSHDNSARLWQTSSGTLQGPVMVHPEPVAKVEFSPNGEFLATGCADYHARLWQVTSGMQLAEPLKHTVHVEGAAFSTDSSVLATAGGNLRFWKVPDAVALHASLPHMFGGVSTSADHVVFSPDGKLVLAGGNGRTACLWDVAAGSPVGAPMRHSGFVNGVAFSPLGDVVATASDDGTARLWQVPSGRPTGAVMQHQGPVNALAFSPDGRYLLTGSDDYAAQLWKVPGGEPFGRRLDHQSGIDAVAFSNDGKVMISASDDHTARIWSVPSGKPLGPFFQHDRGINSIAITSDDKTVVTGSDDATARLWPMPRPLEGTPDRLQLWVETLTGMALNETDAVQPLGLSKWKLLEIELDKTGGPPRPE